MAAPEIPTEADRPLRVCFFRRLAYGVFDPSAPVPIGGAEVRSRNFAVGLAQRPGFEVSYLVGDQGQPAEQWFEGVRVVKEGHNIHSFFDRTYASFRRYASVSRRFPFLHIARFHPSLFWTFPILAFQVGIFNKLPAWIRMPRPRPLRFIKQLGVDVLACFGTNVGAADIIASARAYGLRSMLFIMHDWEADRGLHEASPWIPRLFEFSGRIRFAAENADCIIVQTRRQQDLVRECYGREAMLIRNPIDLAGAKPLPAAEREFVFWVGRAEAPYVPHKRPELCLELARRLPQVPFVAVMNPVDATVFSSLKAAAPANITIIESIPRDQIESYFRRAAVFLSTSSQEGFPNTFLQAAKYQVPVVSLAVDPDGFLSQHGCGIVCSGDLDRTAATIADLWQNRQRVAELGAAARRHVEQEYEISTAIDRLAGVIQALVKNRAT